VVTRTCSASTRDSLLIIVLLVCGNHCGVLVWYPSGSIHSLTRLLSKPTGGADYSPGGGFFPTGIEQHDEQPGRFERSRPCVGVGGALNPVSRKIDPAAHSFCSEFFGAMFVELSGPRLLGKVENGSWPRTIRRRTKRYWELQNGFKGGNHEVFLQLWNRYLCRFRRWALRHLSEDKGLIEDILSDTCAKLLERREQYDVARPWAPWAFAVLRNIVYDFHRKQAHWPEPLDSEAPLPTPPVSDLGRDLDECLRKLPEELRNLVVQHFLEDTRQNVIARKLGTSNTTVSVKINKPWNFWLSA